MRTPFSSYILLVAACLIAPYVFDVRPRSRRDWLAVTVMVAFLTWLLVGFASLRSR